MLPPAISGLSALAGRYDTLLCDVWGVLHDGATAHAGACRALVAWRTQGGTVVLVSNSPRPGRLLGPQLGEFGVPEGTFDVAVTSGDVTRALLEERPGVKLFHIGPLDRDGPLFEGLDHRRVPWEEAELVVCTGLWDEDRETPEHYRALLTAIRARGLPLICANPDVVVERGERLVYCAGAIADLYASLGGETIYAGKPHAPIYRLAMARAAALRGQASAGRVLAIGDSVRTDLSGAAGQGLDCLFILAGIHAEEIGAPDAVDLQALARLLAQAPAMPVATMPLLDW